MAVMARMTQAERITELRALEAALGDEQPALAQLGVRERARVIAGAASELLDVSTRLGHDVRVGLIHATGLSAANVELGLRTTLELFSQDALEALATERGGTEVSGLCAVVLAGNVFSAAARPLLLPLLCGVPVIAKAASREDVFPRALAQALTKVHPGVGRACAIVSFGREDGELTHAWLEGAAVVSVYGDDETVAALTQAAPKTATVLAHGHGLGAACLGRDALGSRAAAEAIALDLARDVAAYDQHGCLSPHAVLVEAGGEVNGATFAALLAHALEGLNASLPRGELSKELLGQCMQWRGVAAATGSLFVRQHAAVSFEARAAVRPSPGHRQLAVLDCRDLADARVRLAGLGPHLKALALGGERARGALADLTPYPCAPGAMQTPPLDAMLDGLHPLAGYLD